MLSLVLTTSGVERPEDSIFILEVVMDDIDEEGSFHHVRDQLARGRFGLVQHGPLVTELVRLIFPCHEADGLDDRRLNDLLAGEYTPRNGIRAFGVVVRLQVSALVDRVVRDR